MIATSVYPRRAGPSCPPVGHLRRELELDRVRAPLSPEIVRVHHGRGEIPRHERLARSPLRIEHRISTSPTADSVALQMGIYYLAEPDGRDDWQDIPDTLERGNGDCEDLATWRCAELRVRLGVDADLGITKSDMPLQSGAALVTMYHIVVVLPDGAIEDPSRRLGMR